MQARTFAKLAIAKLAVLGVGYAVYRYLGARRRNADLDRVATALESFDEDDLDFDVGAPFEMAHDDATTFAGLDEAGGFHIDSGDGRSALRDQRLDTTYDAAHDLGVVARDDDGDLYGVVTQAAVDTDLTAGEAEDGFAHAEDGETWLEALSASATEYGALPERMLDVSDDRARTTHTRTSRDIPVADRGAGGRSGA